MRTLQTIGRTSEKVKEKYEMSVKTSRQRKRERAHLDLVHRGIWTTAFKLDHCTTREEKLQVVVDNHSDCSIHYRCKVICGDVCMPSLAYCQVPCHPPAPAFPCRQDRGDLHPSHNKQTTPPIHPIHYSNREHGPPSSVYDWTHRHTLWLTSPQQL